MRNIRPLVLVVACALPCVEAQAHGGAYTGPTDQTSAGAAPSSAGGAGAGKGASAGSGSGGLSGAGAASTGSTSRGSRSARGGSGRRGSAASSGPGSQAYDGWEFWWEANRDRYIALKQRLGRSTHTPGSPGLLTARANKETLLSDERPTRDWVDDTVVPALLDLSLGTDDRNILDSTLIALGRSASDADRPAVRAACERLLAHNELSVQGAAALGLGMLGDPQGEPLLVHLLRDDTAGRQLVSQGRVPWLVRSFAALALGLLATDGAIDELLDTVTRLPDSDRDVKVCVIAALGLVPHSSPRRDTIVNALVERLDEPTFDAVIRSYVPTTLGKLGSAAAVPALLDIVVQEDAPIAVRQSAVIGLGSLSTLGDAAVTAALVTQVESGRDQLCRHFALITLARIANASDRNAATSTAHDELITLLRHEIAGKGHSRAHRSWAALAAALYGQSHAEAAPELLPALRHAFSEEHDPSFRGAFALALGLLQDRQSGAEIHASLADNHQNDYRGFASEALGLLRHRDAAPALRDLCRNEAVPETFRLKSATGLGLMGDREAVPLLVESLSSARSLGGLAALAQGLGLIGDEGAGLPLLDMVADEKREELSRAFATVALGLLGERGELPFNAALRADNNYLQQTPAVSEVLRIL